MKLKTATFTAALLGLAGALYVLLLGGSTDLSRSGRGDDATTATSTATPSRPMAGGSAVITAPSPTSTSHASATGDIPSSPSSRSPADGGTGDASPAPARTGSQSVKAASPLGESGSTRASGAYLGPCNTAGVAAFESWRGRPLGVVLDTLDMSSWELMTSPRWWTECWASTESWLVLNVPILFDPSDTLQAGASGAYDDHFRTLARNLVAGGQGDAGIRIGVEFNGDWVPWSAVDDPQAYVDYYRAIVGAMRSVPGSSFTYIWNPNVGPTDLPAERAWPGADVVDIIGLDAYDVSWSAGTYPYAGEGAAVRLAAQERAWHEFELGDHGLQFWADFATRAGKPLAFPEWGLVDGAEGHGGGDNPLFVTRMRAWMDAHPVAFESYFNSTGSLGDHRLNPENFPEAMEAYQSLFGGR